MSFPKTFRVGGDGAGGETPWLDLVAAQQLLEPHQTVVGNPPLPAGRGRGGDSLWRHLSPSRRVHEEGEPVAHDGDPDGDPQARRFA